MKNTQHAAHKNTFDMSSLLCNDFFAEDQSQSETKHRHQKHLSKSLSRSRKALRDAKRNGY
jgi:hypothetical protein